MNCLLKNAMLFHPEGLRRGDVLVRDGSIWRMAEGIAPEDGVETIDLSRCILMPGLVDVHVHFREPGFSAKETIRTGSLAAAHGGFTTVCTMPNLSPVPDCMEHLEAELDSIRRDAAIRVIPYGSITVGEMGEKLADMEAMAPFVAGFSDDGRGVQDEDVMHSAMLEAKRLGKVIAAHCEINSLLHGGYIHDGSYARAHGHKGICSESEWEQIDRDVELVRKTGAKYHACHISTKESVEIIRRAKARGLDVTCETGPHYLVFCEDDLQEDGRFKMNPPLRSAADREALLHGIEDGTIDMIATDHAPHEAHAKARGLAGSAMGVVGLETAFAAMYTNLVVTGRITLIRLIELMSMAPARRFGMDAAFAEGARADLTAFDLHREWTVDPINFLSMGRATPFAGCRLFGKCVLTIAGGKVAYRECP